MGFFAMANVGGEQGEDSQVNRLFMDSRFPKNQSNFSLPQFKAALLTRLQVAYGALRQACGKVGHIEEGYVPLLSCFWLISKKDMGAPPLLQSISSNP
jgi:hypothetical protein